jgi:hypothetical protein
VLDMDSSESPTYGEQEGSAYSGHFGCTCYHPLFVFNQLGDVERCALRSGNVHSLSCRYFAANAVRLQLHALAYSLGNLMRTLAMPKAAEPWSLTSLREKLTKIGTRITSHGPLRHLPDGRGRGVAADVRRHPGDDRPAAGTALASMRGQRDQMPQATTAKVRLNADQSARFSASAQSVGGFDRLPRAQRDFAVGQDVQRGRFWLTTIGNPGNVG